MNISLEKCIFFNLSISVSTILQRSQSKIVERNLLSFFPSAFCRQATQTIPRIDRGWHEKMDTPRYINSISRISFVNPLQKASSFWCWTDSRCAHPWELEPATSTINIESRQLMHGGVRFVDHRTISPLIVRQAAFVHAIWQSRDAHKQGEGLDVVGWNKCGASSEYRLRSISTCKHPLCTHDCMTTGNIELKVHLFVVFLVFVLEGIQWRAHEPFYYVTKCYSKVCWFFKCSFSKFSHITWVRVSSLRLERSLFVIFQNFTPAITLPIPLFALPDCNDAKHFAIWKGNQTDSMPSASPRQKNKWHQVTTLGLETKCVDLRCMYVLERFSSPSTRWCWSIVFRKPDRIHVPIRTICDLGSVVWCIFIYETNSIPF